MVWNENSEILVMLTNLEEGELIKCHQYWPDDKANASTYGNMQVLLLSVEDHRAFVHRKLSVRRGNQRRTVEHFHYTVWPDHGVPQTAGELVDFRDDIRKAMRDASYDAGPVVVHCSAGTP